MHIIRYLGYLSMPCILIYLILFSNCVLFHCVNKSWFIYSTNKYLRCFLHLPHLQCYNKYFCICHVSYTLVHLFVRMLIYNKISRKSTAILNYITWYILIKWPNLPYKLCSNQLFMNVPHSLHGHNMTVLMFPCFYSSSPC